MFGPAPICRAGLQATKGHLEFHQIYEIISLLHLSGCCLLFKIAAQSVMLGVRLCARWFDELYSTPCCFAAFSLASPPFSK